MVAGNFQFDQEGELNALSSPDPGKIASFGSDAPGPPRRFRHGAVSGAALTMFSKGLGMVIGVVSLAIVARILSPDDYGLIAMVMSVTAFLTVFSDFGLSLVTVQRPSITQEQLSALFWVNVALGLLLGLVTVVLAPVLVWFYRDARLLPVTFAVAAVFPLGALSIQHQSILKRDMKFTRLAGVRLAGTLGGALVTIWAAYEGLGYWALVCQPVATAVVGDVASFLVLPWWPGRPHRCEDLGEMLGFGGRLTMHTIIGYFTTNVDKVLLGRFWGAFPLGLYATCRNLMGRGIAMAVYSVGEAAIPAMSRTWEDTGQTRATYRRTLSLSCLISFPAFVLGIVSADDVVLTVLGQKWVAATTILSVFCLAAIPRSVAHSMGWVYVATGRPGRMVWWEVIWSISLTIGFLLGLPFGPEGLAAALAAAHWITLAPGFAYCFSGTQFRMADFWQPTVRPLACALVACAFAVLGQYVVTPDLAAGPARLAIRTGLFLVPYAAATAVSVPLANEGLSKTLQWIGRLTRRAVARESQVTR